MTTTLLAFHNDPAVKAHYLDRVRAHREADEIIHGSYGKWAAAAYGSRRGCAVGCTIHSSDHSAYERELGIPMVLARLEDGIFEALPRDGMDLAWPERFLDAVPVGADLSMVWPRFAVWLLTDRKDGVVRFAESDGQRAATRGVATLYRRVIAGKPVERAQWEKARAAASSVASVASVASAAYAASYASSAAAASASASADAASYAAAAASYAAADAAADAAARVRQADKLIDFLKGA